MNKSSLCLCLKYIFIYISSIYHLFISMQDIKSCGIKSNRLIFENLLWKLEINNVYV